MHGNNTELSEFWKNKKVLITGGSGFIGINLAKKLLNCGADVVLFVRKKTEKINDDLHTVKQVEGSISDRKLVESLVNKADIIFHLAANPSVWKAQLDPVMDSQTNIIGTLTILNSARNGNKKVILPSSIALYRRNACVGDECAENIEIVPDTFYSLSKYTCEQYCMLFYELFNLPVSVLRLGYVYGPGLNRGVIYDIVKQIVEEKKQKIELFMLPENKLDFVYVDDAVDALMTVGSSQKAVGKIFNIGSNRDKDIYGIINDIVKLVNSGNNTQNKINVIKIDPINKTDIITNENADKTPLHFNISHENAETVLRWKPKYNLEKGLIEVIKKFKETKQNNENT